MHVFPGNREVVRFFNRFGTQWRIGNNGPVGLDYALPLKRMDLMRLTDEQYTAMLDDLSILEQAALNEMLKD